MKYNLKKAAGMVDWAASKDPKTGHRPVVKCRVGTSVNLVAKCIAAGTLYTAWIRRHGRIWSNTRLLRSDGTVRIGVAAIDRHAAIVAGER